MKELEDTMVVGPTTQNGPSSVKGEYRKIQELASGGMGSVDLARAIGGPRSGDIVAIKRLHPHLEREKQFADMFFDEALITSGLRHPNVGMMFDWGTDSSGRYLAMEFVPGDSLLAVIRDAKKLNLPVPVDLALFIIGKTAEGLHAAHELRNEQGQLRHLVHRDVTPSNVLIGIHGEVKLIDFGVAKSPRQAVPHVDRNHQGQVRVHVARAGSRLSDRSPVGRFFARRGPVGNARSSQALPLGQRTRGLADDCGRPAAADSRTARRRPAGGRQSHRRRAGKKPG